MSFSLALVLSGDSRPLEDAQEFVFVAMEAFEQAVERRVAGWAALEDAVEWAPNSWACSRPGASL